MMSRRSTLGLIGGAAGTAVLASGANATEGAALPPLEGEASLRIISPSLVTDQARQALPPPFFEYIHGAAGDEWTLRQNGERLRALALNPRRLAGFAKADTAATFMGRAVPAPLYVCPMGAQDYAHAEAELASARGAARAGIPYLLSSASNRPLEAVAQASGANAMRLFAIYLNEDEAVNRSLALRAKAAGYSALVMTVDSLGPGVSERFLAMGAPKTTIAGFGNFDPALGGTGRFMALKRDFRPEDVTLLRESSGLPVLVKGLLRPEDAERAVAAGAAGVIVSNHGGRTLDGAPAAIDALPSVVEAVRQRVPVLFDSGVRRGTDVIRALALGASAVGIGRPVLDAMAVGGAQGVADMLDWFRQDLATQMLLVGAATVAAIRPDLVEPQASEGMPERAQ